MRLKNGWWFVLLVVLAACAGPSPKGILDLSISGTDGVTPKVLVSGPNSYSREFSSNIRVPDLEPGDYTLNPQTVKGGGFSYSALPQTIKVISGQTVRAAVGYAPTTGRLEVNVVASNLPTGITPRVEVRRASNNNLVQVVTANTTLDDLIPDTYTLTLSTNPASSSVRSSLEDGDSPTTAVVVAGQNKQVTARFVLNPGSARVTVAGLSGTASPAGTLSLTRSGTTPITQAVSTNGVVNFANLEPGQYSLSSTELRSGGQRFSTPSQNITITSLTETPINLTYTAVSGVARITVAGLVGSASPAGSLTLTRSGAAPIVQPVTTNGVVTFEDLTFGSYAVTASNLQTLSQTWVPVAADLTTPLTVAATPLTRTVNYLRPNVALTLTGLTGSAGITVTATSGGNTITQNFSSAAGINFVLPSVDVAYTLSATATQGTTLFGSDSAVVTATAAVPAQTATLTMTAVPSSQRIYAAGNGSLSNTGWAFSGVSTPNVNFGLDAVFQILTSASASNVSATSLPTSAAYRVQFDASGNLYALYQFVSGASSNNRIIRISAANLASASFTSSLVTSAIPLHPSALGTTPSDLAFDTAGNLWVSNEPGVLGCIQASRLSSPTPLTTYDQTLVSAMDSSTPPLPVYRGLDGFTFDSAGNLWFTSGRYIVGSPGEASILSRIPVAGLTCAGGSSAIAPDIRLNVSGPSETPIYDPKDVVLSPDGSSLWLADGGLGIDVYTPSASDTPNPPTVVSGCNLSGTPNFSPSRESVFRVALSGGNIVANTPTETLKPAVIADRISVAAGNASGEVTRLTPAASLNKGMQQAYALSFDSTGRLWVATNNHAEIDSANPCFPSMWIDFPEDRSSRPNRPVRTFADYLLTDRQGKLFVFTASQLSSGALGATVRNLTPVLSLNAPLGNGLTGVAVPPPPAP